MNLLFTEYLMTGSPPKWVAVIKTSSLNSSKLPFIGKKTPFVIPFICLIYPSVEQNRKFGGFTLVELIITLTIVGILLAIAVPAMQTFILDQRLTTQTNDFIADINIARNEAIKRGTNVVLCKQGGTVANPSCGNGATWGNGWIVFVDNNSNGAFDNGETVIHTRDVLEGSNSLNSVGTTTASFTFASTGLTTLSSGTEIAMRFCDSRGSAKGVTVYVNFTGRARIDRTALSCT